VFEKVVTLTGPGCVAGTAQTPSHRCRPTVWLPGLNRSIVWSQLLSHQNFKQLSCKPFGKLAVCNRVRKCKSCSARLVVQLPVGGGGAIDPEG
jgi:hypothetical protein